VGERRYSNKIFGGTAFPRVPTPLHHWSRRRTGEGPAWEVFLVESWRDVSVRMRHAIWPRENTFPTQSPRPPLWLSTDLEVDSKSLSQSIRFIDLSRGFFATARLSCSLYQQSVVGLKDL